MARVWQIFEAPGTDGDPLPVSPSPWHEGRIVRIPHEHWSLILQFASMLDHRLSDELNSYSTPIDNNPTDEVPVALERLSIMVDFLGQVRESLRDAPPLVREASDEVPDELTNEEHVRMIDAIAAVLRESMDLRQPFMAWRD